MKKKIVVFLIAISFILIISATLGACGLIPTPQTPSEYKITFASNGGTKCDPIIITPGSNSFQLPTPERSGYSFGGWYTDKVFTKSWSDYMAENNNTISSNIVLYAKWVEVTLTITLDANGGQNTAGSEFNYSQGVELELPIPTRKGCKFVGWYDDANRVVGEPVTGADSKVPDNYTKKNTVTLYAQWDIDYHIVPITDAGNVTLSSNYYVLNDSTQDTITFTATSAPRFEFKEWQIVDNSTTAVTDNPMTHKYTKDVEISAVFEGVEVNITFNSNYPDPEVPSTETVQKIRYASSVTVDPPAQFPGYNFTGWFTAKTGGERVSNRFGDIEVFPYYNDRTLYAQWREGVIATDFEYKLVGEAPNAHYKITGYMGASQDLYIPFMLNGITVKEIGNEFVAASYNVDKVIIPFTIETIGSDSFAGFTGGIYFDQGADLSLIKTPTFSVSNNIYVHGSYIETAEIKSDGSYTNDLPIGLGANPLLVDDVYYNFFGHYTDSSIDSREELQALVDYSYVFTAKNQFACKLTYLTGGATLQSEIQAAIQGVSGYRNNTSSEFLYTFFEGKNVIKVSAFEEKADANRIASASTPAPTTTKVKSMVTSYTTNEEIDTGVLPIDYADPFIVYNSEQLLYAVENGYKPMFIANESLPTVVQNEMAVARTIYYTARTILLQNIPEGADDFERITIIHDWIIDHNRYDFNLLTLSQGAPASDLIKYKGFYLDGVFLDGHAVCDGISKAVSLLANMAGVETIRTSGVVISNSENHAWNKVKIGTKWYSMDATADGLSITTQGGDHFEIRTHRYFLLNDTEMGKKNREDTDINDPFYVKRVATGSYNYYVKTAYAEGKNLYIESNLEAQALADAFNTFYTNSDPGYYYGFDYVYKGNYDVNIVGGLKSTADPYGQNDKFQVILKGKE